MRDFNPAYVGSGSKAVRVIGAGRWRMSEMPPKAATALQERRTLSRDEIDALVAGRRLPRRLSRVGRLDQRMLGGPMSAAGGRRHGAAG
jgi:hypothetical protein